MPSRNDPCPCGSGKKFKRCCIDSNVVVEPNEEGFEGSPFENEFDEEAEISFDEIKPNSEIQEFLDRAFAMGETDLQKLSARYMEEKNNAPIADFEGITPAQMYRLHHFPLASPWVVEFPTSMNLDGHTVAQGNLFFLLNSFIEELKVKPITVDHSGALTEDSIRRLLKHLDLAIPLWNGFPANLAYDANWQFSGLNVTYRLLQMAELIQENKGILTATPTLWSHHSRDGLNSVYPKLFQANLEADDWEELYFEPSIPFIQTGALFTLYLFQKFGSTPRPESFYQDAFLKAFPRVIDFVTPDDFEEDITPKEGFEIYFSQMGLQNFLTFFGLAENTFPEKKSESDWGPTWIHKTPLADRIAIFKVGNLN